MNYDPGPCACAKHQAVGGGGGRHLQELLHTDGPVPGQGNLNPLVEPLFFVVS